MTLKAISILLVSLTSFVWGWTAHMLVEARRKEKQTKKELEELLAKLLAKLGPPPKWPKVNPHLPLKRREGESVAAFEKRVSEAIEEGKITLNAARQSIGLPPIERKSYEVQCTTCRHCVQPKRPGIKYDPCEKCVGYLNWSEMKETKK